MCARVSHLTFAEVVVHRLAIIHMIVETLQLARPKCLKWATCRLACKSPGDSKILIATELKRTAWN